MNAQDLRKILEKESNKLNIFSNVQKLEQFNLTIKELLNLIATFLNDEEKFQLFYYPHFLNLSAWIKKEIIEMISKESLKLTLISNENIIHDFDEQQLMGIIQNFTSKTKEQILMNAEFTQKHLSNRAIINLIESLENDESKNRVLKLYSLQEHEKVEVVLTMSIGQKVETLLTQKLTKGHQIQILSCLDAKAIIELFNHRKVFFSRNKIRPYEAIFRLSVKEQKAFVEELENIKLHPNEKKELLATLKESTKKSINTTNLPLEYQIAISMEVEKGREYDEPISLKLDLNRNLTDYKGLDRLLVAYPEDFSEEQKNKFMSLCEICPDMIVIQLYQGFAKFPTTAQNYKEAEEWIDSVITSLNPNYSKLQKMAVIDHAIGKKISYSPDIDTEVFSEFESRAMWKIVTSGYGVCNGIARLEQYMLEKVGIESNIISSGTHAFLEIKNIELPLANGESKVGSTLLDPTWNLAENRFGAIPNYFCINYEEARRGDIDSKGIDHFSHKNDARLQGVALQLDDESLRNVFTSVRLADEKGIFPISTLLDESKHLHNVYKNNPMENIKRQFFLLSKTCPEFATCQNSTMEVLSNILLSDDNLEFDKCVVHRVFDKKDQVKSPILYVYITSKQLGEKFFYADKQKGEMVELPKEEFTSRFECYERDLEERNGIRPWEELKEQKQEEMQENMERKLAQNDTKISNYEEEK